MMPFFLFILTALFFCLLGYIGLATFQSVSFVLRCALAVTFLLTASAHWGKRRPDLIRMVPPAFPRPDLVVTITGVLELLGIIGLYIPGMVRVTSICLAVLLAAMLPANIYAARHNLTIAGRHVPSASVRGIIQVVFIATLAIVAWLE